MVIFHRIMSVSFWYKRVINAMDVTCSFVKEEKSFWSSSVLSSSDRVIILSISAFIIYLQKETNRKMVTL